MPLGNLEKNKQMKFRNLLQRGASILTILVTCLLSLSYPLRAQQVEEVPTPAAPQSQAQIPTKAASDVATPTAQPSPPSQSPKDDRIFFALPNYLTVEKGSNSAPLTTGQKFKAVAEGSFDPVEFVFIGIQAGIGLADDTNPTYGHGVAGYAKYSATSYTDAIIGNFGTGAIFPTLLRQDPRYFQMGKGNFFRRFGYAGVRVLVTRSDSGKTQFNFSEFLGNSLAAGLSNTYHPGPHTIASNLNVLSTQIMWDAVGYELKEFWPDIHHFLTRRKPKK
jgi:hypothetical protein